MREVINKHKISDVIMYIAVYISFCACYFMSNRASFAQIALANPGASIWLYNDAVVFLVAGMIPTLAFFAVTWFIFRHLSPRLGAEAGRMRYALMFFYIPANVLIFGLRFFYFLFPPIQMYGNIILIPVITAAFFAWFLKFSMKNYVAKEDWGFALYIAGSAFILIYTLLAVLGIAGCIS